MNTKNKNENLVKNSNQSQQESKQLINNLKINNMKSIDKNSNNEINLETRLRNQEVRTVLNLISIFNELLFSGIELKELYSIIIDNSEKKYGDELQLSEREIEKLLGMKQEEVERLKFKIIQDQLELMNKNK